MVSISALLSRLRIPVFHERCTTHDFDDSHEQRLPVRVRQLKFFAGDEKHGLRATLAYGDVRSIQVRARSRESRLEFRSPLRPGK